MERVALLKSWLELEWAKREWRFIPRLASQSIKELGDAKAALTKRIAPHDSNVIDAELDTKESLKPTTVPTPPPPEPPRGGGDLDNK